MKDRMNESESAPPRGSTNRNPEDIGLFALLWEDYRTHDRNLIEPGLMAIWVHRFGNWRMGVPTRVLRLPFTILYRIAFRMVVLGLGIDLCYSVKLGRRVRIWHHGGIFINAESIGNDVHVRQNVAIGITSRGVANGTPVIEDGVDIYTGVCIAGPVRIGRSAVIGANTVVTADVAPNTTVIGNPARQVPGASPRAGPGPEIRGNKTRPDT